MIRFMDPQAEMALRQSHQLVAGMCGFAGDGAHTVPSLAGPAAKCSGRTDAAAA